MTVQTAAAPKSGVVGNVVQTTYREAIHDAIREALLRISASS